MFANEEEKTKDRKKKSLYDEKETKEECEIQDESTKPEDENLKKTHEEFENIPDDFQSYEEGEIEEEEECYILRCEICR